MNQANYRKAAERYINEAFGRLVSAIEDPFRCNKMSEFTFDDQLAKFKRLLKEYEQLAKSAGVATVKEMQTNYDKRFKKLEEAFLQKAQA